MSLQRAYVACERCFLYAAKYIRPVFGTKRFDSGRATAVTDSNVFASRMETMRALEEELAGVSLQEDRLSRLSVVEPGFDKDREYAVPRTAAISCLGACMSCDFVEARVKDFIDAELKKQRAKYAASQRH